MGTFAFYSDSTGSPLVIDAHFNLWNQCGWKNEVTFLDIGVMIHSQKTGCRLSIICPFKFNINDAISLNEPLRDVETLNVIFNESYSLNFDNTKWLKVMDGENAIFGIYLLELNEKDNFLIGWGNELLDMFEIPHIHHDYKKPLNISAGDVEILPGLKMQILESSGHTPGGVMFYFPQYKILMTGDTLFAQSFGRFDFPGGNQNDLMQSIKRLYNLGLDDSTYVVHGHGQDTTIGWLKQHNPFFKD